MSRKRLGRGLDALLSTGNQKPVPITTDSEPATADTPSEPAEPRDGELRQVAVTALSRSQYQPRREFDDGALEELAASIRTQGLMQPLVVRPGPEVGSS